MRSRRLFGQLFTAFLAVSLATIVVFGWVMLTFLHAFYFSETRDHLAVRARILDPQLPDFSRSTPDRLKLQFEHLAIATQARLTLILPDGRVLADSQGDVPYMENHADRPEFKQALTVGLGSAEHYSQTLHQRMIYVAVPLTRQGRLAGVLRLAVPAASFLQTVRQNLAPLLWGSLAVLLLLVALSWLVSRLFSQRLELLRQAAERFTHGELGYRLRMTGPGELRGVAESLNRMAEQLHERLQAVQRQQQEQGIILSSMQDGVLAVDSKERLLNLNQAAAELFGVDWASVRGRNLREVIRHPDLHRFVEQTMAGTGPIEGELVIFKPGERTLNATGNVLREQDGQSVGALIVLKDITRQRKLENIRRDFVANVSHELKTPVTLIQGAVETLLGGARNQPAEADKFLAMIEAHAQRLNAIIEDLLLLSRVEQGAPGQFPLVPTLLGPILQRAILALEPKAKEQQVEVLLDCPPDLSLLANATLLEQACINLLDNAIKYSDPGKRVVVSAESEPKGVKVRFRDEGTGIETEHLDRIFERFYRADKARSRKTGGTGLGLAIVKHIVQVHGGQVTVESTPGKGSCFTLTFPDPNKA